MTSKWFVAALALAACHEHTDGARLEVTLTASPTRIDGSSAAADANEPLVLTTSAGEALLLTEARVTMESIDLEPCGDGVATRLWRSLSLVSTALAHEDHDEGLEGPWQVAAGAAPLSAGQLEAAAGRYCEAHVEVGGFRMAGTWDGEALSVEGDDETHVAVQLVPPLELDADATLTLDASYGGWLDDVPHDAADIAALVFANVTASLRAEQ